jgi:hypothetical protein
VHIAVAGLDIITPDEATSGYRRELFEFEPAHSWPAGVPISMRAKGHFDKTLVVQVTLKCERTTEAMEKWQLQTWGKLRAGYEVMLRQAERQVDQEARAQAVIGFAGGRPERENRSLERDELKKWSIKAMRLKPHNFNAIEQVGDFQEISPIDAEMQAPIVSFFEEAFEWGNMSYFLYPYYWSRRESWRMRSNIASIDSRHTAFLNAGAARVIVPITPGYEARVLYYLESDPAMDELVRLDGPPTDDIPSGTAFEDLWLELLTSRHADTARGSGSLAVVHGNDTIQINEDSNWRSNEQDLGRELYIGGDRYLLTSVADERDFTIDRLYEGSSNARAIYATGSVPYGPPWLVNVPTSLVILQENRPHLG